MIDDEKIIELAKKRYPRLPWKRWEERGVDIYVVRCEKDEVEEVEELRGAGSCFSANSRIVAGNYKTVDVKEEFWSSGLAQSRRRKIKFKLGEGGMLIFRHNYGDSLGRNYDSVIIYYNEEVR